MKNMQVISDSQIKGEYISIITPVHNSSTFVHRLLDSVVGQTYPCIEHIFIDNDSQDNTYEVIKSYGEKYNERGYILKYMHESDLGPSAAVNNGLKFVTGSYLTVVDSDDFYAYPIALEKMVKTFIGLSDDYAMLRCQMQEIEDDSMRKLQIVGNGLLQEDPGTLFYDCLMGINGYYYPGVAYLYKTKYLRDETQMEIYSQYYTGQNRQLMMPLLYKYKCYTIDEPLVNYLVRPKSVSHGDYKKYSIKKEMYGETSNYMWSILSSIKSMPVDERKAYMKEYMYAQTKLMADVALDNNLWDYFKYRTILLKYSNRQFRDVAHTIKHGIKAFVKHD